MSCYLKIVTLAAGCLFAPSLLSAGVMVLYSDGGVIVGPESKSTGPFAGLSSLSVSVDDNYGNAYGDLFHVEGQSGVSLNAGQSSVAVEIANGSSIAVTPVTANSTATEFVFNASGSTVQSWDDPNGTNLRFSAFFSLHGELSPGASLFYVVSAQLYPHLYLSQSAGMYEVGTINTPGPFNMSFAYNNPAAQRINRDYGGDSFDMSGGVFLSITSSGSGGTSWVSVDPGVGVTTENSGVVFSWEAPTAVPEPASMTLVGLGAVGMAIGAYRRRKNAPISRA